MSAKIMGQVWDLKLSPAERIVLLAMADHADHEGNNVRPSIGLIAWKTDYSERQVKRIIKDLRTAGLLVMVQDATPTTPIHYRINIAAGVPKAPYKSSRRGDILTPPTRGDILTPGDIAMSPGGCHHDVTPRGDIAMSPKPSIEPSLNHERVARKPRATPPPKQTNLDSFHAAVIAYKELSGVRNIAPVVASLIAGRVTDLELWQRVVTVWCAKFKRENVDGMLDWYQHPEKMGKHAGGDSKADPYERPPLPPAKVERPADALPPNEVVSRLLAARERQGK